MTKLQYYKQAIKNQHESTKYLNNAFLKTFEESKSKGDFSEVFTTDFYQKNGCGYCIFLEIENRLREGKDYYGRPVNI